VEALLGQYYSAIDNSYCGVIARVAVLKLLQHVPACEILLAFDATLQKSFGLREATIRTRPTQRSQNVPKTREQGSSLR